MKVMITLGEGLFITVESKNDIPKEILGFLVDITKFFIANVKMDSLINPNTIRISQPNEIGLKRI